MHLPRSSHEKRKVREDEVSQADEFPSKKQLNDAFKVSTFVSKSLCSLTSQVSINSECTFEASSWYDSASLA